MIAIVNIGPHDQDPRGERTYELRINREVVTTFSHKRADGLAACLLEASKAAEQAEMKKYLKVLVPERS